MFGFLSACSNFLVSTGCVICLIGGSIHAKIVATKSLQQDIGNLSKTVAIHKDLELEYAIRVRSLIFEIHHPVYYSMQGTDPGESRDMFKIQETHTHGEKMKRELHR